MTLFGGHTPLYDIVPDGGDVMVGYVHAELLWGWADKDAASQVNTPEGAFAWAMLFFNFAVVREVAVG